jgi:hypothetical protein
MAQEGIYLQLFEKQENQADELLEAGKNGPVFGPLEFVEVANGSLIKLGTEIDHYELTLTRNGFVYYAGIYYGSFSVFFQHQNDSRLVRHQGFDQAKAIAPADCASLMTAHPC